MRIGSIGIGVVLLWLAGTSAAQAQYTTNQVWDANRRLVMTIGPDPDGAGPLLRPVEKRVYDADGQVIQVIKGTASTATGSDFVAIETSLITTYSATGKKVKELTLAGVTQYGYDGADRLICKAERGNAAVYSTLPADPCVLGVSGADGADRITRFTYDLAGQQLSEIRGLGTGRVQVYETYSYTANGQKATVLDARGNLSTLEYDGFDRLAKLRFPTATVGAGTSSTTDYEQYGYDQAGNRVSKIMRRGPSESAGPSTITYTFDALSRETVKDLPGGTAADVYTAYDLRDRVLSARFVSGGGSGIVMTYDKAGRMTSETTFGRALAYGYDPASNRNKVTWPDTSFYVDYLYNAANQLTEMREQAATSGAGRLAVFTYDQRGRRTALSRAGGSGAPSAYGYDVASRLSSLSHDPAGTTYDQSYTFAYNPFSQLASRTDTNASYRWTPPSPGTTARTFDGLNRDAAVVALSTDCTSSAAGYDCRGNTRKLGSLTYSYDLENRLTTVTGGASTVTLAYDPQGRLASTTVGSTVTNFLYDGPRLVGEYNGSGTLLRRYAHGSGTDEPLVWYEGSGTSDRHWLHHDRQGSVVAWSNSSGTVSTGNVYTYGPWGEPGDAWGTGSRFRYTGQIAIPEVKLYYYKARVYDPATGRFLQTDPIGYKDDINLYAYVGGDPMNKADPKGTQSAGPYDPQTEIATAQGKSLSGPTPPRAPGATLTVGAGASASAGPIQGSFSSGRAFDTSGNSVGFVDKGLGAGVPLTGASLTAGILVGASNGSATDIQGDFDTRTVQTPVITITAFSGSNAKGEVISGATALIGPSAGAGVGAGRSNTTITDVEKSTSVIGETLRKVAPWTAAPKDGACFPHGCK